MSQLLPKDMNLPYDKDFFKEYGIFIKPVYYSLSSKKIEALLEIAKLQKYFQCNPIKWIDLMYNIELLDLQSLMIQRSWICPNFLAVATRGIGKTTVVDLELMAKDSLFTNYWCYIASGTSDQATQTFSVLEKLANDNIESFSGATGKLFKNEVVIKNAAGDGFSHSSNGFNYTLYNGSMTQTLNSNLDAHRGHRGSVIFDEAAFLPEEMFNIYGAYTIVNRSLKTGKDTSGKSIDPIRQRTFATDMPYQKFYISSASSTDMAFYRIYRDFAKKQIMGDPDFCCMHLDCNLAFSPTLRGEQITPLLTKSQVDAEMRQNPEKCRREYYCIFTTEGGQNAIIRRGVITRNEEVRKPLLCNDTGDKKFVIAYDPARSRDNSVILVSEIYEDNGETMLRLVNCINLIDVGKKRKSPMQTPDQVAYLKELILDYNIGGGDNYDNIYGIYIDAGSGGGGVNIADYLMEDWKGKDGKMHRGLIDKEYSKDYVDKFPNAVDKIHLISPTAMKSEMFEALIELANQDKIKFTATYDNKGYLTIFDIDEEKMANSKKQIMAKLKKEKVPESELEARLSDELSKIQNVSSKIEKLDWQEELALVGIDALKEELVNMVRIKRDSGKDSFELAPEKRNKLNDDRAYVLALSAYALQCERRKKFTQKRDTRIDDVDDFINSLIMRRGRY